MTATSQRTARILIVDDEEMLRRHTQRHLEKAGYATATAADAAEARVLLATETFEVVLCDVKMPGESGLELIRDVTVEYPDISAVMMSGLDDTKTAEEALRLGAVGYVVKPFERNELLINIANALNRRELLLENRRHQARLEELVELQANYDLLTGLANRSHISRRLDLMLATETRTGSPAVLFLDLDHFKVINDSLGHEAGDQILKEVALRLAARVGPDDLAGRFGGDAFVLLIDGTTEQEIERLATELLDELNQPHTVGGRELFASASIGIVPDLTGYPSADTVLRDADAAMHQAKAAGRSTFRMVDEMIRARARKRLDIETGLRTAIEEEQLLVYYQPQFSLNDRSLVGFEALVRWRHPDFGVVLPGEFIPVAEETGLILPMGRWVLGQACDDLLLFREKAGRDLTMSVNVSAAQLVRGSIVDDVAQALTASGLPRGALCLEITESVLLEGVTAAIKALGALKGLGVRISIDDFGTGYSSLSYIGKLPIDELKIDRSFVVDIADESGAALVRGIIGLAKALGHHVVAEGIETQEQLDMLEADDCDVAQGFLLGRPAAVDKTLAIVG